MKRTMLLVGVCCALMATAAAIDAAKSVAEADEAPSKKAIDRALSDLFAERESWGTAPAGEQGSTAGTDVAGVAAQATGDLAAFLDLRATWGTGPAPKTINAPLAKGASSDFPVAKSAASPGPTPNTVVHPVVERPLPKLAADSQADIVRARNALLRERESWGTEPSKSTADPSSSTASTATGGTGDLAALLAERESWGTGPAVETVKPPLAKGAKAKLELAKAAVAGEARPPIVHELEQRPIPQVAEIAPDKIREAMNSLLKERESWGTEPSAGTATGGTGNLADLLAERESWGTGPSQSVAATTRSSQDSRAACAEDLRRLASERRIFFRSSSARLQSQSNEALELIAKTIKDCGEVVILIEGHTDSIGPSDANQALSEARARSVLEYLATAGINRSRLKAIGHGETKPVTSNATSKGRALNRRIEFSIR